MALCKAEATVIIILLFVLGAALLGGCGGSGGAQQTTEVPIVLWPGHPRAMRITEARWDGGETLVLKTVTEDPEGQDLIPMICWGFTRLKGPSGGVIVPKMPLLGGTYKTGYVLDLGIAEPEKGPDAGRIVHLFPMPNLEDEARSVLMEGVPIPLDPTKTRHEIHLGFPVALAKGHLDNEIQGKNLKPLFVTLWKNFFVGDAKPRVWEPSPLEELKGAKPQKGTFTLPPATLQSEE